jgi:uncharacterized protein (TIGR02996 family)
MSDAEHPELSRLLAGLHAAPDDEMLWAVISDWLEEHGQAERAELVRLVRRLRGMGQASGPRKGAESRIREMLDGGVRPCVPEVTNSVGLKLVLIPAGTFWMGSPRNERGHVDDEARHRVTLTRPYWLGAFPVTQAQYRAVTGANPSHFSAKGGGRRHVRTMDTAAFPVERVSWFEAVRFCAALSKLPGEKAAGRVYRLPTEAEWEHACRAGLMSGPFHFGWALNGTQACCDGSDPYRTVEGPEAERTCAVGGYSPNAFGLSDMHGNVSEWCADWFGEYLAGPVTDPSGPDEGASRVTRGGAWSYYAANCRSARRPRYGPEERHSQVGLRVACDITTPGSSRRRRGGSPGRSRTSS